MAVAATTRAFAADADVHRLSTEEYERIVATGALADMRVELLDGLLVDRSPQDIEHAWIVQQLTRLFAPRADLLRIQLPLAVAEGWTPEPDVALAESHRARHPTTALFVAEVAYSSHRVDMSKAVVYARASVPVYWIVDLPARLVRVHTDPGPEGYASVVDKRGDDALDAGIYGVAATTVAALLGS